MSRAVPGWRSKAIWGYAVAWSARERLVFVDVTDDKAKRIGEQHRVGNLIAKAIDDVCGPAFPPLLLLIAEGVEDFLKLDVGAIRNLPRVVEHHGLNLDIYVRGAGVEEEGLKGLGLCHPRQRRALQIIREEVERVGEITLQRGVIAPVIKLRPAR